VTRSLLFQEGQDLTSSGEVKRVGRLDPSGSGTWYVVLAIWADFFAEIFPV
jgi:hypothetical protein